MYIYIYRWICACYELRMHIGYMIYMRTSPLFFVVTDVLVDYALKECCSRGVVLVLQAPLSKKKNLAQRHSICLAQDSSPVEGQMRRLTVRASRRCNFYRLDLSRQQPRDLKFSVEQSFFL